MHPKLGTFKLELLNVWPSRTPFNTSRNIGDFLINFLIKIFHCAFPISLDSLNLYASTRVSNSTSSLLSQQRYTVTFEGFRLKHLKRVLIELLYQLSKNLIYQMIWLTKSSSPDLGSRYEIKLELQSAFKTVLISEIAEIKMIKIFHPFTIVWQTVFILMRD